MLTTAQAHRISAARQEAAAAGTEITTVQLPDGLVVVSDHDPSDGQTVSLMLGPAGQYI